MTASIAFTSSNTPLNNSTLTAGVEVALTATIAASSISSKNLQLVLRDEIGKLIAVCSATGSVVIDGTNAIVPMGIPAIAAASIKKSTIVSFYLQATGSTQAVSTLLAGEFLLSPSSSPSDTPPPTPPPTTGNSYTWSAVSGSLTMTAGNGYACTGFALQTLTLPASATTGDRIAVWGANIALFRIAQNAGQQIRMGDKVTSIGIAGRIDSLSQGDFLELFYLANQWVALPNQGNFDIA